MKSFIVCTFVAFLFSVLAVPQDLISKWEEFKAKHGKEHPSHEEAERMQRFAVRDAEIEDHNARYAAGLESFSRKHTIYSDLSDEEVDRYAFGLEVPVEVSKLRRAYPEVIPNAAPRPTEYDLRTEGVMTPVKNQKHCSCCYAFAAVAVLEAYLNRTIGKRFDFSEQDVVDCTYKKYLDGAVNLGCSGGWPASVFEYFNETGTIREHFYEYTSGDTTVHGTCQNAINNHRTLFKGGLNFKHVEIPDEDDLADLVYSHGPVLVTLATDNEFKKMFIDLHDGIFDRDAPVSATPNHAVVLAGYGTEGGKDYWLFKNSWGEEWGVGGYGKIVRGKNMCNITVFGALYIE